MLLIIKGHNLAMQTDGHRTMDYAILASKAEPQDT